MAVINRLAGRARHVAVATHDADLAGAALERLREVGTSCELELIFGLPLRRMLLVARSLRVPVRIYIPYGHAWLPYVFGQVTRNPWIALWILRDLLFRAGPKADLIASGRAP